MGFYILWPHTAAFSKQSTIIRSDKRANTVHSRVKKKHPPIHPHTRFVNSLHPCIRILFCFLSHFHTSPCMFLLFHYFCSFLFSHQQHWRVELHLTHALKTMQAFQLMEQRQIFVSMSSSPQSGSVGHDLFQDKHNRSVTCYSFTTYSEMCCTDR